MTQITMLRLFMIIVGVGTAYPLLAQETAQKEKKVQFFVDAGIILSEESVLTRTNPQLGFMGGLNIYLKVPKVGIRYRKEFWYLFDDYRIKTERDQLQELKNTDIAYYEKTFAEVYRKFSLLGSSARNKYLSVGLGYGWVYPYYHDRVLKVGTIFASFPVSFLELELRGTFPLEDAYADPNFPSGSAIELGNVSLSLFYRFPKKYYQK